VLPDRDLQKMSGWEGRRQRGRRTFIHKAVCSANVKNASAVNSSTCEIASAKSRMDVRSLGNVHRRSPRLTQTQDRTQLRHTFQRLKARSETRNSAEQFRKTRKGSLLCPVRVESQATAVTRLPAKLSSPLPIPLGNAAMCCWVSTAR